ncbi:MFS transporter [[Mycobacterium] burgundiense]|uniref:MFS transporter n=1 Tax=[Mycobacterium] burgundiense TaxID=3064286 RepID=UPI002803EDB8|nr:MFS transporter [Mycolicibacterium sp. MU0053]
MVRAEDSTRWWDLLAKPSYRAIVAGAACVSFAGYSLTTFAPAFLMRSRGMSLGAVAWQYGLASGLTGILGLLLVGRIADRLSRRDPRWLLWLVAAMTAAMVPFSFAALLVDGAGATVWFIALSYVIGTAYMAPSIAAIQRLVRPEQRATASAIFLFFSAIVGSAGPFLTGVISDALLADFGAMSLERALFVVPVVQIVAIGCYLWAGRRFVEEIIDDVPEAAADRAAVVH